MNSLLEEVALNRVICTHAQVREARAVAQRAWRNFRWFGVLLVLQLGLSTYSYLRKHAVENLLFSIMTVAVILYLFWWLRSRLDIHSIEKRFAIRPDALVMEVITNEKDTVRNVIPWTTVLFAKEVDGAVEIRLRNSSEGPTVPAECFRSDKERQLLLRRCNPVDN